jgi:hypothetical protein
MSDVDRVDELCRGIRDDPECPDLYRGCLATGIPTVTAESSHGIGSALRGVGPPRADSPGSQPWLSNPREQKAPAGAKVNSELPQTITHQLFPLQGRHMAASRIRALGHLPAALVRGHVLGQRKKNKDSPAGLSFGIIQIPGYFPLSIFSLICLAQASAVLFWPCAELALLTL